MPAVVDQTAMNVLFVHFGENWIAGSEVSLLEMLRKFSKKDVTPFLWCNSDAMREAARAMGIPVYRDDFAYYFDDTSSSFSPRTYFNMVRKAGRLMSQTQAELVHCNSAAPSQWMLPACWWKGVPMLVNLHSPYLRRSRYVLGLHLADRVVGVASTITESLLADGMEADRISVVYNGFDDETLMQGDASGLRAALRIPPEAIVGAIAGSLIRRKGHDVLFEAMKHTDGLSRSFHLLVIGDGPEEESIKKAAAALPVHFLGHRTDLGAILRDCADFLVAPSRQEAFGRVIIEAAIAGIPSIGSNVDGIPEAILDNVTGLLVPPESPAALTGAIARLVEDDALRRELGIAAQHRAKEKFSIETCTEKISAEYRATIKRYRTEHFSLLKSRRIKPYWNLLRYGSGPSR
jgi:hypothetical protein